MLQCLTKNPCFFQLPTAEQWYTAATAVFDVIFTKLDEENSDDSIAGRVNQTLVNHVDIGARFSDARCAKALPMAFSAYKEGLQSHYLQEVHNAKVNVYRKFMFSKKPHKNLTKSSSFDLKFVKSKLFKQEFANYCFLGRFLGTS